MPKGTDRTHINDANVGDGSDLTPKAITKEEFGRRVYSLMLGKGWTQAELHRQSGLTKDSISNYVRGNILPSPDSLMKLATALSVKPEQLLPNIVEGSIRQDIPSLELKVSSADPTRAWLKVNREVRTSTAAKVIELLEADLVAAANRS